MSRALIIVDVQNDFCQGGSLGVTGSGQIFKYINELKHNKKLIDHVFCSRDWHPKGHVSFSTIHGKMPFTTIQINGKKQELWPDHCVADTKGAQYAPQLEREPTDLEVLKGRDVNVDSYSAFEETKNGIFLRNKLNELKVQEVFVVGLAYDFCVGSTALDAKKYGFKTSIIKQATKPVAAATAEKMDARLKQANIPVVSFESLKKK